jgi:hypothetical protein
MCVLKRKSKNFEILPQNHIPGGNFMRGIDCAHSRILKMLPDSGNKSVYGSKNPTCTNFPESGSGKRFQASEMRAINSPHEIIPRNMILRDKFQNFSIFASIHAYISLNQGQRSIFTLREWAQSIFARFYPLYRLNFIAGFTHLFFVFFKVKFRLFQQFFLVHQSLSLDLGLSLGGPGKIAEIDETLLKKYKKNK